jgi:hypothetical protein
VNLPVKALLTLLICLAVYCASASNIVVLGRLVSNEPMSYVKDECPEDSICMRSWWKSVIKIQRTV